MNSIKSKGIVFSTILISTIVVSLSLTGYFLFKAILIDENLNSMERIAGQSASQIDSFISSFLAPLEELTKTSAMRSMDWSAQRDIIEKQINPNYLNIAVVTIDGYAHYVDGNSIYLGDRDYIEGMFEGTPSFSNVITSRVTNEPVIMVGIPIIEGPDIVGGLAVRIDTSFLNKFVHPDNLKERGRSYIISSTGDFIAHSSPDFVYQQLNTFQMAEESDIYLDFSEFVKESMNESSGHGSYEIGGEQVLMSYAVIPSTEWRIYSGTFESVALAGLHALKNIFIVLAIITLGASAVLSWLTVKHFANPIIELEKLFKKGASGDLNIRFTSYSNDEIGRAGLSFNRMMDKIKTFTYYDPLTKLPNQMVLENEIDIMSKSKTITEPFAMVMVSIDQFSLINETYGYAEGDRLLFEISKIIKAHCSKEHEAYRHKGDEFVLQFSNPGSKEQVELFTQRLLKKLKAPYASAEDPSKRVVMNFSVGMYLSKGFETGYEEVLKALTHAKNYAKSMGGTSIWWYDEENYLNEVEKRGLQFEIPLAIENNDFYLVYQPLINLASEKVVEVEALIRWRHRERGDIYPDQFIGIAEKTGLITMIDFWVFESVCRQLEAWQSKNVNGIMISINISSLTFEQNDLVDSIMAILQKYKIDPRQLQLELTERVLIQDIDTSIKKLSQLRALGIKIAIDDFGIGYSSLSYIVRLPIDSVKIDQSFVNNIGKSKEANTIVTTIINMCIALDMTVIAEGIETVQELDYLKAHKCHLGQGYYFSKPIEMASFEERYLNQL